MRLLLALTVLLVAMPAWADPPPFCPTAMLARLPCSTSADCDVNRPLCTRDANPQLHHAWTTGSCVDPTGVISASAAIQADLCTVPDPKGWRAFTPYNLPAATRLLLDDPDQDGAAVTIYRRVSLNGQGAAIAVNALAVLKYAVFRPVVPLPLAPETWDPPTGDKYAATSILRDLAFESQPLGHANQNTAVLIQANGVKVSEIRCTDVGVCIHVNAPGDTYNANHAGAYDVTCAGTWGACLFLNGPDANDFLGMRGAMSNGPGVLNSGYLNNNFYSFSCETCGERASNLPFPYTGATFSLLDEGSSSGHFGWYLELGDPFLFSTQWSTTFFAGNAQTRTNGPHERLGGGWSKARFASFGSPYEAWLGRNEEVLLFQSRGAEGTPSEIYAWQLKIKLLGGKPVWGLHSEDNITYAPFGFRSSNVTGERGRSIRPENTRELCCNGEDDDGDGLVDFADNQCDPNTMEC